MQSKQKDLLKSNPSTRTARFFRK